MVRLAELTSEYFKDLYEISKRDDPMFSAQSLDHFISCLDGIDGWVVLNGDETIGCITLTEYKPNFDAVIHALIKSDFQGRWVSRSILKEIGNHLFNVLNLVRVSGFGIVGVTDKAARFLIRIGFSAEGYRKKGAMFKGELMDFMLFGLLKEDCKWL